MGGHMLVRRMLFLATVLGVNGCDFDPGPGEKVVGSGVVATEARVVRGFHTVTVEGVDRILIEPGDDEVLTITAEDNVLRHLASDVNNGHLRIGGGDLNLQTHEEIVYHLTFKQLDGLTIDGVMEAEARGVDSPAFVAVVNGVSNLTVSGRAEEQTVRIDGVSTYLGAELVSRVVSFDGSGVFTAFVHATHVLRGTACGAGSITYFGDPVVQLDACKAVGVTKG